MVLVYQKKTLEMSDKLIVYSIGFLFDEKIKRIVLIKKNKPLWQKGLWNGIGGKMEPNESPEDCMVREFEEETGVLIEDWDHFALLYRDNDFELFCFRAFSNKLWKCRSVTAEKLVILDIKHLHYFYHRMIPNLEWIMPLALDKEVAYTEGEYI